MSHLSNSAISMERADLELMLESLVSLQRVSAEISALLTERLDVSDGDPEQEDATGLEDEGITPSTVRYYTDGPGCIASDPGEYAGDEKDCAWIEWENLSRSQKGSRNVIGVNDEDAEDDDPGDSNNAEDEHLSCPPGGSGPGCTISDPDAAVDDQGCDDINDDREEEESLVPDYGIDQTAGMPPFNPGVDRSMLRAHRDYRGGATKRRRPESARLPFSPTWPGDARHRQCHVLATGECHSPNHG